MDYARARETMVEQQVRPWDVLDARVLDVLTRLPREEFVAAAHRKLAYADLPLPLAHGEFMMKPVVEGRALQALQLDPGEDVLEIGTGSGFLTACLGLLAREVISLERHEDLADAARARLSAQHVGNAQVVHADAFAWQSQRRFDAICVTGAVTTIPPHFSQWLRPGGRMFIVHGLSPAMEAVLMRTIGGDEGRPDHDALDKLRNDHGRNDVNGSRIESLFETDLPYLAGAAPVPAFKF